MRWFTLRTSRVAAGVLSALCLSLGASACSSDAPATQAATWRFFAPGGQTLVRYAPAERASLAPLSGEDLLDPSHTISLSDYAGKIVVLNAWGQWCAPCRTESDDMQAIHEQLQTEGGSVIGINVRDYARQQAQDWVRDNGLTYPSIYDPPFISAAALGGIPASVVPTTIVLDKQHRPAAVFLREVTSAEVLEVVAELAAEPEPKAGTTNG